MHGGKIVLLFKKHNSKTLSPNISEFGLHQEQTFCYICGKFYADRSTFIVALFGSIPVFFSWVME